MIREGDKVCDGVSDKMMYIYRNIGSRYHKRSYYVAKSASRPLSSDNQYKGQLVVGWVTTSEYWLLLVLLHFLRPWSVHNQLAHALAPDFTSCMYI